MFRPRTYVFLLTSYFLFLSAHFVQSRYITSLCCTLFSSFLKQKPFTTVYVKHSTPFPTVHLGNVRHHLYISATIQIFKYPCTLSSLPGTKSKLKNNGWMAVQGGYGLGREGIHAMTSRGEGWDKFSWPCRKGKRYEWRDFTFVSTLSIPMSSLSFPHNYLLNPPSFPTASHPLSLFYISFPPPHLHLHLHPSTLPPEHPYPPQFIHLIPASLNKSYTLTHIPRMPFIPPKREQTRKTSCWTIEIQ